MLNNDYNNAELPQWVDMGSGDQQSQVPDMSSFVSALKKRMNTPQMKDGKQGMAMGKAAAAGGEGGAPTSL